MPNCIEDWVGSLVDPEIMEKRKISFLYWELKSVPFSLSPGLYIRAATQHRPIAVPRDPVSRKDKSNKKNRRIFESP